MRSFNIYQQRKPLMWIYTFFGILWGYVSCKYLLPMVFLNNHSPISSVSQELSNEIGLWNNIPQAKDHFNNFMFDVFNAATFKDVLTHDLFLSSYNYIDEKPYFFSKYFHDHHEEVYGANSTEYTLEETLEATVSYPSFYEPFESSYGDVFIDMIVESKNPTMNAYLQAKFLDKETNIKILSLSANENDDAIKSLDKWGMNFPIGSPEWIEIEQTYSERTNYFLKNELGSDSFIRIEN